MTRSISFLRPMTGSSWPSLASSVRSRPNESSAGVVLLPFLPLFSCCLRFFAFHACSQKIENFLAYLFELQSQVHQHLCRHAVMLTQEAEQ